MHDLSRTRSAWTLRVLATLIVVLAAAGCGDDDPPAAPAAPEPEPLAYFDFASGAGGRIVADTASLSLVVGPDGAGFALFSEILTEADAGRTIAIGPDDHADFAQAVQLLTNGVNDEVALRRAPVGGWDAVTTSDEATSFTGGALADQEPDFAGAEITGFSLVLSAVSIASPGRNPNDDGLWTDVMIQGQVVILGHP